tara:strand:- start:10182 stop:10364 length:183 start_codon:yes stop_codon:yes gene_type:complete
MSKADTDQIIKLISNLRKLNEVDNKLLIALRGKVEALEHQNDVYQEIIETQKDMIFQLTK